MRISVKGRYALAAVVEIARNADSGGTVAVINISNTLGISKIYLEQVFTQLKKAGVLLAVKGSKGGYLLARPASKISAWEVLSALEAVLVEPTETTVEDNSPEIEIAMQQMVFEPLDTAVQECLKKVSVRQLLDRAEDQRAEQAFMLNL